MPPKLLVADDSVTIRRVIELTFAAEGIEVVSVSNGRQAIECIPQERPDVVLADVDMPERSGYDVAWFIKNTPDLAHVPVILLSGAFEPVDDARAQEAGCRGVLAKPFEPEIAVRRVRDVLAQSASARSSAGRGTGVESPALERELEMSVGSVFETFAPVPAAPQKEPETLDEYLDRLDQRAAGSKAPEAEPRALPLRDTPSGEGSAVQPPPTVLHEPSLIVRAVPQERVIPEVAPAPNLGRSLADEFAALLAAEETGEDEYDLPESSDSADAADGAMTDAGDDKPFGGPGLDPVVALAAQRVVEALSEHLTKDMVSEVVRNVAERLVREDLHRHPPGRP